MLYIEAWIKWRCYCWIKWVFIRTLRDTFSIKPELGWGKPDFSLSSCWSSAERLSRKSCGWAWSVCQGCGKEQGRGESLLSLAFSFKKKNHKTTPPNFLSEYRWNLLNFRLKLEYFKEFIRYWKQGREVEIFREFIHSPLPLLQFVCKEWETFMLKKKIYKKYKIL